LAKGLTAVAALGVLVLAACGGDVGADSIIAPRGERIVIRTKMTIAAVSGSEPIATGSVLAGSTLGGSTFCAGGKIVDSHASRHPAVEPYGLIARTITCQAGTLTIGFTPGDTQDLAQTGSWTVVRGAGAFKGLRGSGEMKTVYDPDDDSLARETLTGTATR
jgi:hypothetical protein